MLLLLHEREREREKREEDTDGFFIIYINETSAPIPEHLNRFNIFDVSQLI